VAHDCVIGNYAILANNATLAGHVLVEDRAIIGGLSAVHQFVRVGTLAIVGGCSKVVQDVPPYMIADGHPASAHGVNTVGLDRAGFSKEDKRVLKQAFKILFRSGVAVRKAQDRIERELPQIPAVQTLLEFLKGSERGLAR